MTYLNIMPSSEIALTVCVDILRLSVYYSSILSMYHYDPKLSLCNRDGGPTIRKITCIFTLLGIAWMILIFFFIIFAVI